MAPQGMEGSFDMMNQQRPMTNGAANPSQGNHALQDYQMQLMLLEQQNKKRLLMARQEQDNINHVPGTSQPGQIQSRRHGTSLRVFDRWPSSTA